MGHSVGKWNECVLVVDTVGFNDRAWMNAYPRMERLHVIERYNESISATFKCKSQSKIPEYFRGHGT
jgi:hypothetical protein